MIPMKILVIEDDISDCNACLKAAKDRKDIEIVAVTDSDIEGLRILKNKKPEGIILDLELNNSSDGNTDALGFIKSIKKLNLQYKPIVIVTTHVTSQRTHSILHKDGADLILVKDHPRFSYNQVFNNFINYREEKPEITVNDIEQIYEDEEKRIQKQLDRELDLIGLSPKMKGRNYVYDAILYLIHNEDTEINIMEVVAQKHKKSVNTIINGIQNAISKAWAYSAIEDLEENYTAIVNHETGVPTPMEFIYYYVDKIKKLI